MVPPVVVDKTDATKPRRACRRASGWSCRQPVGWSFGGRGSADRPMTDRCRRS